MGAGVPRPLVANRAKHSTTAAAPITTMKAPRKRPAETPSSGGRNRQRDRVYGNHPATVAGAIQKKTKDPSIGPVFATPQLTLISGAGPPRLRQDFGSNSRATPFMQ